MAYFNSNTSDSLNDHANDLSDLIMKAVLPVSGASLSQQTEEVIQGYDHRSSKNESADVKITEETDSSVYKRQPAMRDAAMESTQVDGLIKNDKIGQCAYKSADEIKLPNKSQEISSGSIEESNKILKYAHCSGENNHAEAEESSKNKPNQLIEFETTSKTLRSNNNNSSEESEELCSIFKSLLGSHETASTSSANRLNCPATSNTGKFKIKSNIFKYIIHSDHETETTNSSEESDILKDIKTDAIYQRYKETIATRCRANSNPWVKDLSKKTAPKLIDDRNNLDGKAFELNTVREFSSKAGSSKELTATEPNNRRLGVHSQPLLNALHTSDFDKRNSIVFGLQQRKKSRDLQTDSEDSGSDVWGSASKSSLKRSGDSQTDVPKVKHRRRCMSAKDVETEEVGRRLRVRCISADVKKGSVDSGIGQAGGSMDNINIFQTRKRKVGSKEMIKEFSWNSKKLKQSECVSENTLKEESSKSSEDSG